MLEFSAEICQKNRASGVLPTRPPALTKPTVEESNMADAADSAISHDVNSGERWLPVPGFEGLYEVSDHGQVRSVDRVIETRSRWGGTKMTRLKGRRLTPTEHVGGHLIVALGKGNMVFVHRLVLSAFIRFPQDGEECRHLDGDKKNNRLGNLCWGSRSDNIADRKRLNEEHPARGEASGKSYLKEVDVRRIRAERSGGKPMRQIAREMGFGNRAVRDVCSGRTWAWLS